MTDGLVVVHAVAEDAAALTALTRASKAAWGYSAAFMARVDDELAVSPEELENQTRV
jgi:hypothetical protein